MTKLKTNKKAFNHKGNKIFAKAINYYLKKYNYDIDYSSNDVFNILYDFRNLNIKINYFDKVYIVKLEYLGYALFWIVYYNNKMIRAQAYFRDELKTVIDDLLIKIASYHFKGKFQEKKH